MTIGIAIPLIWLAIAAVGLWFSFNLVRDSYADLKELDHFGIGNGRRAIAWTTIHTELIRAFYHSIFAVLGAVYVFTELEPARPTVAVVMTAAQAGLVLSSYLVIRLRKTLRMPNA